VSRRKNHDGALRACACACANGKWFEGFELASFSRAFRAWTGMSPAAYRKELERRGGPGGPAPLRPPLSYGAYAAPLSVLAISSEMRSSLNNRSRPSCSA
jgi:hypothetical protein